MTVVVSALVAAVLVLSMLVFGLLRSHALILRALDELGAGLDLEREAARPGEGLGGRASGAVPVEIGEGVVPTRPAGSTAHAIVGTDLDGSPLQVEVGRGSTLLAFLSSGCSVCQDFWEAFAHPDDLDVPAGARLVVVTQGPDNDSIATLRKLAPAGLTVVVSDAGWSDYEIPGSPYFVHVENGTVTGEGSSTSWDQVRGLMGQGVADVAEARARRERSFEVDADGTEIGRGTRDDLPRMDRELLAAGIHPGHDSLYRAPDAPDIPDAELDAHDHSHEHDQHHGHHREEPFRRVHVHGPAGDRS